MLHYKDIANRHPTRPTSYAEYFGKNELGLAYLHYPFHPRQIPDLENSHQIAINVYTFYDDVGQDNCPIYVSDKRFQQTIDLLYWTDGDDNAHYAWIRNFSRFMAHRNKHHGASHWCKRCLCAFQEKSACEAHVDFCARRDFEKIIVRMPPEGEKLEFKNIRYQLECPFVGYADCEALVPRVQIPTHSQSIKFQHHVPCSVGIKVVSRVPGVQFPYKDFFGTNCVVEFLDYLLILEEKCKKIVFDDKRMVMDTADHQAFSASTKCFICGDVFDQSKLANRKVRDHDHITGKYRGAALSKCNLQFRKQHKLPIFFHNFRGYDSHIITMGLKHFPGSDPKIIAQGLEKYLTLTFGTMSSSKTHSCSCQLLSID